MTEAYYAGLSESEWKDRAEGRYQYIPPKTEKEPITQAITTKYFGPGNVRGARIKATSGSGRSVTISYPYELNTEDAHRLAAETLCHKLGWTISLIQGSTADGYAFVFA